MTTEEEQHKEIYTQFGAAAARASIFEQCLSSILLFLAKFSGQVLSGEDYDKLQADLERKPLGPLLNSVRAAVAIPPEVEKYLKEAHKRRNHLIHHFFRENAFEFTSEAGRTRLVKHLQESQAYIFVATKLANDFLMEHAGQIGITVDNIRAEAEEMRKQASESEQVA